MKTHTYATVRVIITLEGADGEVRLSNGLGDGPILARQVVATVDLQTGELGFEAKGFALKQDGTPGRKPANVCAGRGQDLPDALYDLVYQEARRVVSQAAGLEAR